LQLRYLLLTK